MTKRIPQVGDKYKCLVKGRVENSCPTRLGDVLEVGYADNYRTYFTNGHSWNHSSYPNDFVLVEGVEQDKQEIFYTLTNLSKPPLGLTPRHIAETGRVTDILEAMLRYVKAGKAVDREWLAELIEKIKTK